MAEFMRDLLLVTKVNQCKQAPKEIILFKKNVYIL